MVKKTIYIALVAAAFGGAAVLASEKAEEVVMPEPLFAGTDNAEEMQKCQKLDPNYMYGEAEFDSYGMFPPPAGALPKYEEPGMHGASFLSQEGQRISAGIRGKWKDLSVPRHQLELAPLPIDLQAGKTYGFCYLRKEQKSGPSYISIENPESIVLIKEM